MYKTIYQFHLDAVWEIRENPDMRMINTVTGSEIIFTGMDKAENVKSLEFKVGHATDLWYEELTEEKVEDNLITLDNSIRAYGMKCRLILTFNPPLNTFWIFHWLESQLGYRFNGDTSPVVKVLDEFGTDCLIHHSTYKDNKWNFKLLPSGEADYSKPGQYAAKLERLRHANPYKYRVDCLGFPGTAGESVFNANKVSLRISELVDRYSSSPPILIQFSYELDDNDQPIAESISANQSSIGETTVYIEPNIKHPYVAALDTAGEGADFYAMHVFDNITDEQAAVFHSNRPANECMIQVYGLLRMYNNALVAPEVNFSEYPIQKLKEWGYSEIYQRDKPLDERHDGLEQKLGFRTTVGNRQSMIDNLIEWSATNLDKINDLETLEEMLAFTKQVKNSTFGGVTKQRTIMAAEAGAHDDLIMSLAILLKARVQQKSYEVAEITKVEGYWTRGELNLAVAAGRVDEEAAKEYMQIHKDRFKKAKIARSRYAR
jgi:phage terminase large subunit